ncbi:MAG: hypothetical protein J7641_22045 [Cyanobacteria bacterium SID2]|nr:hypothetical protein [Cyanobacteria bacterium SID2]MBP0004537.1 hypothetical protein [Cyanobacteria bacterium SBC]
MSKDTSAPNTAPSAAEIETLLSCQAELTEGLDSLRKQLDRLIPQLEEARAEAVKPPEPPFGDSPETLLESATQAALDRYTWKAKTEGLQVTVDWVRDRIDRQQKQLNALDKQIAAARERAEREAKARRGIEAMNAAIDTVKQQLIQLKQQGCHHLYAVNLPEFCLDERGQVQVRPNSFRVP